MDDAFGPVDGPIGQYSAWTPRTDSGDGRPRLTLQSNQTPPFQYIVLDALPAVPVEGI